jgi:Na+-driven multidrug efflux pump
MPFRSLASVLIMGVMRAGGDSKKAMFYDVLPIYFISLPLGFLLSFLFELPIYVVLPVMYSKRIVKCVFAVKRLFSGK